MGFLFIVIFLGKKWESDKWIFVYYDFFKKTNQSFLTQSRWYLKREFDAVILANCLSCFYLFFFTKS